MYSYELSKKTGIRHSEILYKIRNIIDKYDCCDFYKKTQYRNMRNRLYPAYIISDIGVSILLDNSYKTPEYKNISKKHIILKHRMENNFALELEKILNIIGCDMTKQYMIDKYRLDIYIKKYNINIEYDEKHHKYKKSEDLSRDTFLKKIYDVDVIRCSYKKSICENVGLIVKKIIEIEVNNAK